MSEDVGIEPRTVAILALALALTTRLDLIHFWNFWCWSVDIRWGNPVFNSAWYTPLRQSRKNWPQKQWRILKEAKKGGSCMPGTNVFCEFFIKLDTQQFTSFWILTRPDPELFSATVPPPPPPRRMSSPPSPHHGLPVSWFRCPRTPGLLELSWQYAETGSRLALSATFWWILCQTNSAPLFGAEHSSFSG